MHRQTSLRRARGFTMIEILVTLVVTAVGMLGLAGFVVRATTLSADSVQRGRATVFLNDMAGRLSNDKANAANYVGPQLHGTAPADCDVLAGAAQQLCQWSNLLAGANDGSTEAAGRARFLGYRGCITQENVGQPVYTITVTWGSMNAGTPPTDQCGAGVFGDDSRRRVLRMQVRVANLAA